MERSSTLKSLNQAIEEHISKFGKATYIGSENSLPKEIKDKYKLSIKGNKIIIR